MKNNKKLTNGSPGSRCFTRRDFLLSGSGLVLGAALPLGCGKGESAAKKKTAADPGAQGTPWADTDKIVDLVESVHLADINHFGEFMDFGTAARFKYTLGGWMSGWDNDTLMNGMSYTWATSSPSRIYFTIARQKPLSFVIRTKKEGSDSFSLYLNDKPLRRVLFKGNDWEEHRVEATVDTVVAGENSLKFVYQTAEKKIGGAPASFAIDYIRIIPEGEDSPTGTAFDAPRIEQIKQRFKAGDTEREALILNTASKLSYYVEVPPGAKLCFSVAAILNKSSGKKPDASVKVLALPVDGGQPIEALSKSYSGTNWHDEMIDVGGSAGRFTRIDLEIEGPPGGRVALGNPAIRIAPPKIELPGHKKRNAIIVLIDTLRADKLTSYAKTRVRTPAFAKFVKESTLFEHCQAPSNWTKPSCTTVLTGLYPDSHKARGHGSKVCSSIKLASEIFTEAGFVTGAFIANGYLAAEFGFKRGWSQYINFIRENKKTEAEHVYKESLDFIAANKEKPFFTYIQTIDPHVPYDPPPEDLKLYDASEYEGPVHNRSTGILLEEFKRKKVELNMRDRRRLEALYDGEVTYHDRHFGHFLDGLNKLGVLDDTAIIVCADHGEEFFDHESLGHGHTLFQELLHVPLVMRAPAVVPAGKRLKNDVGLADILPTLLTATGVPVPKGVEGRDLLPICNGALPCPLSAAFSSFYSEADERNLSWTVRKGDFKLRMKGPAVSYLYNLADDPREKTDADTRYPLALRALRIALGQFIGAPDKHNWASGTLAAYVAEAPKGQSEEADMPEDLKQQLRALGYIN
jgi:choline-sulfatase